MRDDDGCMGVKLHETRLQRNTGNISDKDTLPGVDARFPNTNQTKHCWQNYVDYHKCILAKGEDFAPCRQVRPFPISSERYKKVAKWPGNHSSGSPTGLSALVDGMSAGTPREVS